jgi:LPXTG-motif cell wall-anchored protein
VPLTSAAPTEAAVATMALSALALLALGAGALLRKRK